MKLKRIPRIIVTPGDVNGIGPEVALAAMLDPSVRSLCTPVFLGTADILTRTAYQLGRTITIIDPHAESDASDGVRLHEQSPAEPLEFEPGAVRAAAGQFAHDCLRAAAARVAGSEYDAVCTAPLNKEALGAAGIQFPGHTEILADCFDVRHYAMMLYLSRESLQPARNMLGVGGDNGLAIAHVTLHTSLDSVPALLTSDSIVETGLLLRDFVRRLGIVEPSLGLCALNPHGGENGLFGSEEASTVVPAADRLHQRGVRVSGPWPADTLVRRAVSGEFDGLIALYHDQGHIPVKLIGFDRAVNVTLGIPIIRTSPTHGTAFEIAGCGEANPAGMIEAMKVAARLAAEGPGPR